jgi:hypothetical protein
MHIGLVVAPRFETSDVYRHLRSIEPRIDHAFVMRSQHRDAFADFAYEGVGAVILELSSAERASERGCTVGEILELPPRRGTLGVCVGRSFAENDDFVYRHNTSGIVRFLEQSRRVAFP